MFNFLTECNEYADLAYNETFYMERYGILKVSKVSTCAFAIVPLIVGGVRAVLREFPHMVRDIKCDNCSITMTKSLT